MIEVPSRSKAPDASDLATPGGLLLVGSVAQSTSQARRQHQQNNASLAPPLPYGAAMECPPGVSSPVGGTSPNGTADGEKPSPRHSTSHRPSLLPSLDAPLDPTEFIASPPKSAYPSARATPNMERNRNSFGDLPPLGNSTSMRLGGSAGDMQLQSMAVTPVGFPQQRGMNPTGTGPYTPWVGDARSNASPTERPGGTGSRHLGVRSTCDSQGLLIAPGQTPQLEDPRSGEQPSPHSSESPAPLPLPFIANKEPCKYLQLKQIGEGGCGTAWVVHRTADAGQFVAKIVPLSQNSERKRRYALNEALYMAECNSPFVVAHVDHWTDRKTIAVTVMEYVMGTDLSTHLKAMRHNLSEKKCFTEGEAGVLFAQLLLSLHHIHSRNIIHRDVKSGNVFLCSSGLLKIGDFGLSTYYNASDHVTIPPPPVLDPNAEHRFGVPPGVVGTPLYLAPELWMAEHRPPYSVKSDIWALGVVFYEILCAGKRPFTGTSEHELGATVLFNRRASMRQHVPSISTDMVALVEAMLSSDGMRRPTALEALSMPVMRHYMSLLVSALQRDTSMAAEMRDRPLAEATEVMQAIENHIAMKARSAIQQHHVQQQESLCNFEGFVEKLQDGSGWKQRYLLLTPSEITLTLRPGSDAAATSQRSVTLKTSQIVKVTVVETEESMQRYRDAVPSLGGSGNSSGFGPPKFYFDITFQVSGGGRSANASYSSSGSGTTAPGRPPPAPVAGGSSTSLNMPPAAKTLYSVFLAVPTRDERDVWVKKVQSAIDLPRESRSRSTVAH